MRSMFNPKLKINAMNTFKTIFGAAIITLSLNTYAGDCPPLSGEFVIGASEGADFATVTDAANALKCGGVSGPVNFLIEDGTYNERVSLSAIAGSSAFNTITFESKSGNSADVVISYGTS